MKKITLIASLFLCFAAMTLYSQVQMNQRISNKVKEADLKLNEVYQRILFVYKTDTKFIKNLKTAQRLWIKFRDAQIEAKYPEYSAGRYGDSLPVYKALYLSKLTEVRTKELQEWLSKKDQSIDFVNALLPWHLYSDGLTAAALSGKKILLCLRPRRNPMGSQMPQYFGPNQQFLRYDNADQQLAQFVKGDRQLAKYLEEHFILVKIDTEEDNMIEYNGQKLRPSSFLQLVYHIGGMLPQTIFCESNGTKIDLVHHYYNQGEFADALHFIAEETYRNNPLSLNNYLAGKRQKTNQPVPQPKVNQPVPQQKVKQPALQWYSYTDGLKLSQATDKKILLDVHASWCVYSIDMDKTYEDSMIKECIEKYFIPVKVEDTVAFYNKSLAAHPLLGEVLKVTGFPATIFFGADGRKIDKIQGFQKPGVFIHILRFFAEERYKNIPIEEYLVSCGVTEKITR